MVVDKENLIRQRAYAIWEAEGYPEGRQVDHWLRAEAEVELEAKTNVLDDGRKVVPDGARQRR